MRGLMVPSVRRKSASAILVSAIFGFAGFAAAQAPAPASAQVSLERQTDEAFRQIFQRPADSDALQGYARLLVQAGNYEGGIAALERLLVDPNAPPIVRIELASLYLRLKAYPMAQSLLEEALKLGGLSPAEESAARDLLREAALRTQRSILTGVVSGGLRHQSNPTYVNDASTIYSASALIANPGARPRSDTDLFVSGRLNHEFDLEQPYYLKWVSTLGAYLSETGKSSGGTLVAGNTNPNDLFLLDGTTGFQFRPIAGNERVTLRPHVLFQHLVVQQHRFMSSVGAGADLKIAIDERTGFSLTADTQKRDFANRIDAPTASLFNGSLHGLRASATRAFDGGHVLSLDLGVRLSRAERSFYEFDALDYRASYSKSYAAPLGSGNWTTSLWLGGSRRDYRGEETAVLSGRTREDRETRIGVSQLVPIVDRWLAQLSIERARNRSNIVNYDFTNTSTMATVIRPF